MKFSSWMNRYGKYLGLLGVVLVFVYFIFFTNMGIKLTHINVRQASDFLKSLGAFSVVLGMLAVLVQTIIPFAPFVIVAGANVLAFGLEAGFLINYSMSCLGAVLAFYLARRHGSEWVDRRLEKVAMAQSMNKRMSTHGFTFVLFARMIPVLPSSAINLAAGVSKISFRSFLFATLLGKLPIVYMESTIAHDLLHFQHNKGRLLLFLFIFLSLMIVGQWINKKITNKKSIGR